MHIIMRNIQKPLKKKRREINIKPTFLKDSHIQLHSVAFDMAWVNFGHFE